MNSLGLIRYGGYGYSYGSYDTFWNRSKKFDFIIVKQFLDNEWSITLRTFENNKNWFFENVVIHVPCLNNDCLLLVNRYAMREIAIRNKQIHYRFHPKKNYLSISPKRTCRNWKFNGSNCGMRGRWTVGKSWNINEDKFLAPVSLTPKHIWCSVATTR